MIPGKIYPCNGVCQETQFFDRNYLKKFAWALLSKTWRSGAGHENKCKIAELTGRAGYAVYPREKEVRMPRFFLPDLRSRNITEQELMDRLDVDHELLQRTVRQFRWINALFSSSRRLLCRHVFSIMEQDPSRTYSLLDVGAGGCDIAQWMAREARRRHLELKITALDNDPRILPVALETIRNFPEIRIVEGNALDLCSLGPFDFIFSNHFLHHLSWDEIRLFLRSVIAQTRLAFVMNDLKRSRAAYLGATLCLPLLARRSFAFDDGRLSIRRGFLPDELTAFVQRHFPEAPIQIIETNPARVVLVLQNVNSADSRCKSTGL